MAGFSGTNNQVNNDGPANSIAAGDATQLRGLWDKASDQYPYGGPGVEPMDSLLWIWGWNRAAFFGRH